MEQGAGCAVGAAGQGVSVGVIAGQELSAGKAGGNGEGMG